MKRGKKIVKNSFISFIIISIIISIGIVSAGDIIFREGDTDIEGNLNVTGNINAPYFIGDGSQLTNLSSTGGNVTIVEGNITTYDTDWVSCSDWTNQALGDSVGGNVTHNLNAPLSDLYVKVLISTDGTDTNSFEPVIVNPGSNSDTVGITISQVDDDNIRVQTGNDGIITIARTVGNFNKIDTESWYYKVVVRKTNEISLNSFNVTGVVNISGNISADYFIGDGSQLSNLPEGGNLSWNQSLADTLYLNDDGDNMTGNLNMTDNNITGISHLIFTLGEMIDNLVNGWLKITGNLNVTGDLNVVGNITGGSPVKIKGGLKVINSSSGESYFSVNDTTGDLDVTNSITAQSFVGDGSQLDNISTTIVTGNITEYDTGWLHIYNNDWTNVHLGSDNSSSISNVTHNLNAPLSDLYVKVLISTDGTDSNSIDLSNYGDASSHIGISTSEVDNDNLIVQTGNSGFNIISSSGITTVINTESWYYKVVVRKTNEVSINSINVSGGMSVTGNLDVDGMIRTRPMEEPTCNSSTEGGIYYNSSNEHFYGCTGSSGWVKLDTTYS